MSSLDCCLRPWFQLLRQLTHLSNIGTHLLSPTANPLVIALRNSKHNFAIRSKVLNLSLSLCSLSNQRKIKSLSWMCPLTVKISPSKFSTIWITTIRSLLIHSDSRHRNLVLGATWKAPQSWSSSHCMGILKLLFWEPLILLSGLLARTDGRHQRPQLFHSLSIHVISV